MTRRLDAFQKKPQSFYRLLKNHWRYSATVFQMIPRSLTAILLGSSLVLAAERKIDFARDVQPILAEHCYKCHGPDNQEAGLRWDKKTAAMKGGEHGSPILPGRPSESLLIRAVSGGGEDVARMPKKGDPLSNENIATLRLWVDQGAVWPDELVTEAKNPKDHWAFKAPVRPVLPALSSKDWARTPIDHFVLQRLD